MIYMFSSNYREKYIQDCLNILALPKESIYEFRYDEQWIEKSLWESFTHFENKATFQNKSALIVYVEQPKNETNIPITTIKYYPLRLATILDVLKSGEFVKIKFSLGEYVSYENVDQKTVQDAIINELYADARPDKKFLSHTQNELSTLRSMVPVNSSTAWQSIIKVINLTYEFQNTIFYRFINIRELHKKSGSPQENKVLTELYPNMMGFELKTSTTNHLSLEFFRSQDAKDFNPAPIIVPNFDISNFIIAPEPILINFRVDIVDIRLITLSTYKDIHTGVGIKLLEDNEKPAMNPPLRAPNLYFPVMIKVNYKNLFVPFLILAFSQFLVASAGKLESIFTSINLSQEIINPSCYLTR